MVGKCEAVPCKVSTAEITRPRRGEGGAYGGGGWSVKEEKDWYGEEDNEEEGGASIGLER